MDALPGRWYDGVSSQPRAVRLWRGAPDRLRIQDEAGQVWDWPLAEVVLSPRLGRTPRLLRYAGHGQIECMDDPRLAAWFPRRRSGWVEALADWLERRRVAIALAACVAVAMVFALFKYGVPAAAVYLAERMPRAVEVQTSGQVLAMLERLRLEPSRLPPARQAALREGFARLVEGQPRSEELVLHFAYAPVLGANAFALPDGRIYLTDARVALAQDDDERMAVLAHEAAHHIHRHGLRQAIESTSVLLVVGMLAGDVSGSSLSVSVPAVLLQSGFSRGHEREADAYALALMRSRGVPPDAFVRMLRRLSAQAPGEGDRGRVAGYLSTHPPTPERIRAAEAAAATDH